MKSKMNQLFEDKRSVHVLYPYDGLKGYMEQALDFIHDGIATGDHIIFIENERIYQLLSKELHARFTEQELQYVHHVDNFDFYYSSGNYNPGAIVEYFNTMVTPYIQQGMPFRSWAHVEWATETEPTHLIKELEEVIDEAVKTLSFPLICAYDGVRMPNELREMLWETHPYILKDDQFTLSEKYYSIIGG